MAIRCPVSLPETLLCSGWPCSFSSLRRLASATLQHLLCLPVKSQHRMLQHLVFSAAVLGQKDIGSMPEDSEGYHSSDLILGLHFLGCNRFILVIYFFFSGSILFSKDCGKRRTEERNCRATWLYGSMLP